MFFQLKKAEYGYNIIQVQFCLIILTGQSGSFQEDRNE